MTYVEFAGERVRAALKDRYLSAETKAHIETEWAYLHSQSEIGFNASAGFESGNEKKDPTTDLITRLILGG